MNKIVVVAVVLIILLICCALFICRYRRKILGGRRQLSAREVLDSAPYQIEDVWKATESLPTKEVQIDKLAKIFDTPIWADDVGNDTTVHKVLQNPDRATSHTKMIENASLAFPILIDPKYDVLDGLHRLAKAYQAKQRTIKAKVVSAKFLLSSGFGV